MVRATSLSQPRKMRQSQTKPSATCTHEQLYYGIEGHYSQPSRRKFSLFFIEKKMHTPRGASKPCTSTYCIVFLFYIPTLIPPQTIFGLGRALGFWSDWHLVPSISVYWCDKWSKIGVHGLRCAAGGACLFFHRTYM